MKIFTTFLLAAMTLLMACSKDKSTQPPTSQGTLLLNRLIVSMVPGGSETVTLSSADANGAYSECQVSNGDPSIATVSLSDSTLQITGLAVGTTHLTITNASGKSCALPVQVYDPLILDTGELLITYTDDFAFIGGFGDAGFWRPIPPAGFHALGDFCLNGTGDPNGNKAVMVVSAKPESDAIAFTHSYQPSVGRYGASFQRPIPPAGFVALGYLFFGAAPESTACVREDLTILGASGGRVMFRWLVGEYHCCWAIDQPASEAHSDAYLVPNTFVFYYSEADVAPTFDPAMYVLRVNLPMLSEAPYQDFVPKLTDYDIPPEATVPRMSKAMLAPCTIINDVDRGNDIGWQVANSPFYRLERQVYYKFLYHYHNQTQIEQPCLWTVTSGITTTETERIWNETSISLSMEAGLNFKAFSGKITATVSRTFGYETQTSVSELRQTEVTTSVNVPPGKAAALWQRYNRYILYRHNGTELEPVTSWEFGINSYVVDQYPDE